MNMMTHTMVATHKRNNKRDYRVTLIFIWLTLLTFFIIYDTIKIDREVTLPPLEILEVDLESA